MTHATITRHSATRCAVDFAYDERAKNAVKVLAGADFDGQIWTVPTMSLPALKSIFATLAVAPEVIADYHAILRRLLADCVTSGLTVWLEDGQVLTRCDNSERGGRRLVRVVEDHERGIAQVLKQGPAIWQAQEPARVIERPVALTVDPELADDGLAGSYLKGVKNAHRNVEKKAAIVKAAQTKRRKQQTEAIE